jgi:hypothetical protein
MKKTWLILVIVVAIILGLVNFILSSKIKKEISKKEALPKLEQRISQEEISGSSQKEAPQLKEEEQAGQKETSEPLKGPQPN